MDGTITPRTPAQRLARARELAAEAPPDRPESVAAWYLVTSPFPEVKRAGFDLLALRPPDAEERREQAAFVRAQRRVEALAEWRARPARRRLRHIEIHRKIPAAIRRERLSWPCAYCGDDSQVIDHVRPVSRGGTNQPYNLVGACERCNDQKFDMTVGEWRDWRLHRGLTWPPKPRMDELLEMIVRHVDQHLAEHPDEFEATS